MTNMTRFEDFCAVLGRSRVGFGDNIMAGKSNFWTYLSHRAEVEQMWNMQWCARSRWAGHVWGGGMVDFEVQHRLVGATHLLFVPPEVVEARGAGLVVSDRDPIRAVELFEVAMSTARHFGRIDAGARWHLSPAFAVEVELARQGPQ
jgi:hypothetical protein